MNISELEKLKVSCCGCESCASICPVDSIVMKEDNDGFLYPSVDNKCIDCGNCVKACPVITPPTNQVGGYTPEIWGAYSKNKDIRISSSSGGLFVIFAEHVLSCDGVIFGAANGKSLVVEHMAATNITELEPLKKSKYVQSRISNNYKKIKDLLICGRVVLFTGTPCQVAGLLTYLGKRYENLRTMDFICHGVPSPGLYSDMVKFYEDKYHGKITELTFREKDQGWQTQIIKLYFQDGRTKSILSKKTFYYSYFLKNLTLRKCCFECPYCTNHVSDLTVGDFWGTKNNDNLGTSLLVINNQSGKELFAKVSQDLVFEILQPNQVAVYYIKRSDNHEYDIEKRNAFYRKYGQIGYKRFCRKSVKHIIINQTVDFFKGKLISVNHRIRRFFRKVNNTI